MPLSKARDRERKRKERGVNGHNRLDVQLRITPDIASYLEEKAGNKTIEEYLLAQLEKAVQVSRATCCAPAENPVKLPRKPYDPETMNRTMDLPVYNPALHHPGDKVRIPWGKRWKAIIVPDLDADGNPVP